MKIKIECDNLRKDEIAQNLRKHIMTDVRPGSSVKGRSSRYCIISCIRSGSTVGRAS